MAVYQVADLFCSVNGEGQRSGQLAVFVRMHGCNLRCRYCDTQWANEADADFRLMSTEEILGAVLRSGIRNVTLTGGEPLIQDEIGELLAALAGQPQIRVEVETNGSVDLAPFAQMANAPVFNMDYKLPGSGMEDKMRPGNFLLLQGKDTVKFVVRDEADLRRSLALMEEYGLRERCRVYYSPVFGEIEPETIVNFMKEHQLNDVTLQLQIHKIIWDPDRSGV